MDKPFSIYNNNRECAELLIYGFVRDIQLLLKKNGNTQIIPKSIYSLCLTFWSVGSCIFFKNNNPISFGIFVDIQSENKKEIININLDKEIKPNYETLKNSAYCHIPNISNLLNKDLGIDTKTTSFDGIFSGPHNASLFLYDNKSDTLNISHLITSNSKMEANQNGLFGLSQLIYINHKHGIINEYKGNLFQLKIQDIKQKNVSYTPNKKKYDDDDDIFDVSDDEYVVDENENEYFDIPFKQIDDKNSNNEWKTKPFYDDYLNIEYMQNIDKIFGVKCQFIGEDREFPTFKAERMIKCGIFDLNINKWEFIKPYKYNKFCDDSRLHCMTCYDEKSESVFMITSVSDTAQYDLHKNQWKLLCDKGITTNIQSNVLWIDTVNANILNSFSCYYGELKFKYFDLRTNDSEWMQHNMSDIKLGNLVLFK